MFPFTPSSRFAYLENNHNSLLGARISCLINCVWAAMGCRAACMRARLRRQDWCEAAPACGPRRPHRHVVALSRSARPAGIRDNARELGATFGAVTAEQVDEWLASPNKDRDPGASNSTTYHLFA